MGTVTPDRPFTIDDLRGRATITLTEAAQILGVHPGTAQRYAREGRLPMVKVGRRRQVSAPLLMAQLAIPDRDR